MLFAAWSWICFSVTTLIDCGTSSSGVSVLVAVVLRSVR